MSSGSETLKQQAQSPKYTQATHRRVRRALHWLAAELPLEHHFTSTQADPCYLFPVMDCGAPANFLFRLWCTAAFCALSVWGLLTSCSVWGWVSVHWKCGLSDGSVLAAEQQEDLLTSTGPNKGPFVGLQQLQNTQFVISDYLGVITEDLPHHLQLQNTVCLCYVVNFFLLFIITLNSLCNNLSKRVYTLPHIMVIQSSTSTIKCWKDVKEQQSKQKPIPYIFLCIYG